ncbi:hypothetical protein BG004_006406, partial [Podila humilis]
MSSIPSLPYVVLNCHKPLHASEILAEEHDSTMREHSHQTRNESMAISAEGLTSVRSRIVHPQIHYIFENDPLETELLESVPKSRCITLDLDPKTGVVSNVESFLTGLQVMDVKLVSTLSSAPSTSLFSPKQGTNDDAIGSADIGQAGASSPPAYVDSTPQTDLGKVSTSNSSLEKPKTSSTEKDGGAGSSSRSWTLMIDAIEADDRNHE